MSTDFEEERKEGHEPSGIIAVFEDRLILDAEPPISDEQLAKVEQRIGRTIPVGLAVLWRTCFGGVLDYDLTARFDGHTTGISFRDLFHASGHGDLWGEIEQEEKRARETAGHKWSGRLTYMPFGGDSHRDRLYVCIEPGPDHGAVFAWKDGLQSAWDMHLDQDSVARLADDVPSLFRRLDLASDPFGASDERFRSGRRMVAAIEARREEDPARADRLAALVRAAVVDWRAALEARELTRRPRARQLAMEDAAATGDIELMQRLLWHGCDIDEPLCGGLPMLDRAVNHKQLEAAAWLLDRGAGISTVVINAGASLPDAMLDRVLLRGARATAYAAIGCAYGGNMRSAARIADAMPAAELRTAIEALAHWTGGDEAVAKRIDTDMIGSPRTTERYSDVGPRMYDLRNHCRALLDERGGPEPDIAATPAAPSVSHLTDPFEFAARRRGIALFQGRLILDARPPITDGELAEIEEFCAGPIPEGLKALWRTSFGGELDYDLAVRFGDRIKPFSFSEIFHFDSGAYRDLWGWIDHESNLAEQRAKEAGQEWSGRLTHLPFGGFEHSNRLYVCVEPGPDHGAVFAWAHGVPWPLNLRDDAVAWVADDVPSLFRQLDLESDRLGADGENFDSGERMAAAITEWRDEDPALADRLMDLVRATVVDWRGALAKGDIATRPRARQVAMEHAIYAEDLDLVARLIAAGCDIDELVGGGASMLDHAVVIRKLDIAAWLIGQGADVSGVPLNIGDETAGLLRHPSPPPNLAALRAVWEGDMARAMGIVDALEGTDLGRTAATLSQWADGAEAAAEQVRIGQLKSGRAPEAYQTEAQRMRALSEHCRGRAAAPPAKEDPPPARIGWLKRLLGPFR